MYLLFYFISYFVIISTSYGIHRFRIRKSNSKVESFSTIIGVTLGLWTLPLFAIVATFLPTGAGDILWGEDK